MIGRILGVAGAAALFAVLFYASRYWPFRWWDRPGLFGLEELPPQGNLVRGWLRGTDFAPFELVVWAVLGFLLLSLIQGIVSRFGGRD
ncbi:MAG: hypothetical protein AAFR35_08270 [Pseudomonadota bacterium]